MNASTYSAPEDFGTYDWANFLWAPGEFYAEIGPWFEGFNSENYDGEAEGIAIRGKSGEVLWFQVAVEETNSAGETIRWHLVPSSSRGRELGLTGGTLARP